MLDKLREDQIGQKLLWSGAGLLACGLLIGLAYVSGNLFITLPESVAKLNHPSASQLWTGFMGRSLGAMVCWILFSFYNTFFRLLGARFLALKLPHIKLLLLVNLQSQLAIAMGAGLIAISKTVILSITTSPSSGELYTIYVSQIAIVLLSIFVEIYLCGRYLKQTTDHSARRLALVASSPYAGLILAAAGLLVLFGFYNIFIAQ